ncbi:aspartyl protease [Gillisia sp. Hel_I_86]|uniref:aspartyl protease family protein n=1 Tax=Gillisia sp. Hel_I_86 TaxID=1249981 RepID=UPI0011995345|nr:aspartyl protease family protein [Gillisia sp. Hel_I_86]TVZ27396.1 aspartyl protease [Gillisia sp. Hel_I_86]
MSYPIYILFVLLCFFNTSMAQGVFEIDGGKNKFELLFQSVNDLVVVPIEINGVELSFLLDTGVESSIIFSLEEKDSLNVKNATDILLRGWGDGEAITAIKSTGNTVRIGNASHSNFTVYIVYDHQISLSNRMGLPIHGIIGYDFFKDFVVEFSYTKERLVAYIADSYVYDKCKRCDDFDLVLHKNKPYISVLVSIDNKDFIPMDLLIDSGSGDALWIFEAPKLGIKIPDENFEDFLGFGMGGSVYGRRARVNNLKLGKFKLERVTASFPDTLYFEGVATYKSRNGSLGSQILKRFHSTFDYKNKRLRLKPNKNFSKPFEYDMSGIVLAHEGYTVVKDFENNNSPVFSKTDNDFQGVVVYKSYSKVKFKLEPQYIIVEIRPNSPAALAGLQVGDLVETINKKPAYNYELSEINRMFSSEEGKTVRLKIKRNGVLLNIQFKLKRVL